MDFVMLVWNFIKEQTKQSLMYGNSKWGATSTFNGSIATSFAQLDLGKLRNSSEQICGFYRQRQWAAAFGSPQQCFIRFNSVSVKATHGHSELPTSSWMQFKGHGRSPGFTVVMLWGLDSLKHDAYNLGMKFTIRSSGSFPVVLLTL